MELDLPARRQGPASTANKYLSQGIAGEEGGDLEPSCANSTEREAVNSMQKTVATSAAAFGEHSSPWCRAWRYTFSHQAAMRQVEAANEQTPSLVSR
jgi:hypothetical protein